MKSKIIIALDFSNTKALDAFIETIDPRFCALKIGSELFTCFGPNLVRRLVNQGFKVFLDLKYHDIPNTVAKACAVASDLGVWMLNVHASGGIQMMEAARKVVDSAGKERPLLIAVTVLTSMDKQDLSLIGIPYSPEEHVLHLSKNSQIAGLDGVVCSVFEVPHVKSLCGSSFLTVTPGIRLQGDITHDQKRVATPQLAEQYGSDYWVIGRAVTQAPDPLKVISTIIPTRND